jgi:hypothetical protein
MTSSFDEFQFINNFLNSNLNKEKLKSTLNFTLMWALFDDYVFGNSFNADELKQICINKKISIEEFQEPYEHFRKRYVDEDGNETDYFSSFVFRNLNTKDSIKNILIDQNSNEIDKVWALFKIIHRLRDNLFHGIKEVKEIEFQESNFMMANKAIAKYLELTRA